MQGVSSLSVILPVLNEEAVLRDTSQKVLAFCKTLSIPYEIIFVDDGSTDNSPQILHELALTEKNIRIIRHAMNRGYGSALRSGFAAAKHEYVFFMDSDGQFEIAQLSEFISRASKGDVDMIIGFRGDRKDTLLRRFAALFYRQIVFLLFGVNVRDVNCAFKLFKRKLLQAVKTESEHHIINAELLVLASKNGYRFEEMEVRHYQRTSGKSSVSFLAFPRTVAELVRFRLSMKKSSKL